MRKVGCHGVAAGLVQAGYPAWREVALGALLMLVCYPFDRFLSWLAGWGPRPPIDQDRT